MKLVDNWRLAPRMISVQAMAAASALLGAWAALPDGLRAELPDNTARWVAYGALALLFIGMTGRVLHQPGVDDAPPKGGA